MHVKVVNYKCRYAANVPMQSRKWHFKLMQYNTTRTLCFYFIFLFMEMLQLVKSLLHIFTPVRLLAFLFGCCTVFFLLITAFPKDHSFIIRTLSLKNLVKFEIHTFHFVKFFFLFLFGK